MGIAANGNSKNVLLQRVHRIMQLPYPQKNQKVQFTAFISLVFLMSVAIFMRPETKALSIDRLKLTLMKKNATPIIFKQVSAPNDVRENPFTIDNKIASTTRPVEIKNSIEQLPVAPEDEVELNEVANTLSPQNEELTRLAAIQQTAERDFSMQDAETKLQKPLSAIENNYPYVPSSSFSYQHIEDTIYPKYKADSYRERLAKEDAVKAQLALKHINWKKLEKELGHNKAALEKIKKDIEKELAAIDWKKIQDESAETIRSQEQELSEKLMKDYQETKEKYLRQQALYNNLREQMREHEEYQNSNENKQLDATIQATGQQKRKKVVVI